MMVSKTDSTRCGPLISVTWWLLLVVGEGWGGEGMGVNGHNMLNIHFECWTSMKALNVFILQLLFPDLSAFAEPAAPPSCRLH